MTGIGKRLTELMEAKGITAYKLSKRTGVSQSTLSRIIKNDSSPNESTLEAIVDYFKINETWFLTGDYLASEPQEKYTPEGKVIIEEEYPVKEVIVIPIKGRGLIHFDVNLSGFGNTSISAILKDFSKSRLWLLRKVLYPLRSLRLFVCYKQ